MKKAIIATLVFLVIVTLPFIVNAAKGDIGSFETFQQLEDRINNNTEEQAKRDGETQCVEETDYMRANHMRLLKQERVDYVRHGEINEKYSIRGCFTCHNQPNVSSVPADAPVEQKGFCKSCHDYNGVQPSCFNCHSSEQPDYPRPEI